MFTFQYGYVVTFMYLILYKNLAIAKTMTISQSTNTYIANCSPFLVQFADIFDYKLFYHVKGK